MALGDVLGLVGIVATIWAAYDARRQRSIRADVPPEVEWFANLSNPAHPPRLRKRGEGLHALHRHRRPEEFRTVTRAHIIAWRDELRRRGLGGARSGTGWRRSPRCSNISARRTPSPTTRSKASSGRRRKAAKARRRRSAITRRASCSSARRTTRSRASATAPSCRRCCSTRCGARSCASSRSRISGTRAKACRI
jgi:hypothetical protein